MIQQGIHKLLQEGEGPEVEFKESYFELSRACFETICGFSNAFPAKLIIEESQVSTENWNRPHGNGLIDPNLFSPFPKNPVIAKFFKEIGWVEELGSGVRNTFKYTSLYSEGKDPVFEEGDVFKCLIPLDGPLSDNSYVNDQDSKYGSNQLGKDKNLINDTVNDTVKLRLARIITLLYKIPGMKKGQLMKEFGLSEITFKRDIQKLKGLVEFRGPQKKGGYYLTKEMEKKLKN